ncbi:uncharacterized protein At4g04775 [Brassica rapa]|uniref:uncharacterized protein At4g04775 n=1 Tax=Brassica campestris TaxID=3711 RepID=UPI00142DD607|nr:uncharacterized protein At4g04775 [Brassica rapa]
MSSSSSSSLSSTRSRTVGIPTTCWCGSKLTTFGAQTKENLFRRFYRCKLGVQRKTEHHLFKWVDEAIVDEVNMVDAKHNQLKEDVDSFKIYTTQRLEKQAIQFDKALIQLNSLIADKATSSGTNDNSTIATKDTLQPPNQPSDANNSRAQLINIAVAAIVVGTMTWIYAKITN